MTSANVRVILVRPKFAGNVGAVARVMRNTGFDRLTLVAPEADRHDREARKLSTQGEIILDRATVIADLKSAVADCVFTVGATARTAGPGRTGRVDPPEAALANLASASRSGPCALVFGPETNGLTNEEIDCCHALLTLPLEPVYPAMNLAQSAAVCLYLLRRSFVGAKEQPPVELPADADRLERLFEQMKTSLERIEYLRGERSEELCAALRRMILRRRPTVQEANYLFGLARQIQWFAKQRDSQSDSESSSA